MGKQALIWFMQACLSTPSASALAKLHCNLLCVTSSADDHLCCTRRAQRRPEKGSLPEAYHNEYHVERLVCFFMSGTHRWCCRVGASVHAHVHKQAHRRLAAAGAAAQSCRCTGPDDCNMIGVSAHLQSCSSWDNVLGPLANVGGLLWAPTDLS